MIVYSTFLEVNGLPTMYRVYKNGKLAFLNPFPVIQNAPILFAKHIDSDWEIKGTTDNQLVRQVIDEVADI